MNEDKKQMIGIEDVMIGTRSSRLSSVVFFLLCFVPVFSTILYGSVDSMTWIFISLFWAAIVLLWLAEAWRAKGVIFNPSSLQLPLIGLILVGLVQLLPLGPGISGDLLNIPYSRSLTLDPLATRFFLMHLVIYVVFFAACLTFINTETRLKKVVLLVIIFGAVMAFLGILQRLASPESIYGLRTPTQAIPFGPFVNQHHFAALMQMTGGVAFAFIFGKKTDNDKKLLLTIALVIMSAAVLMTGSRGGLLGLISVFAFVALLNFVTRSRSHQSSSEPLHNTKRTVLLVGGGAVIIISTVCLVLFLGGNDSLVRGVGMSGSTAADFSSGRTHFWSVAIKIFFEHPILGAGLEAFGVAYTPHDNWNGILRVEQAHNEYLQMLADAGVAGVACLAGFIYLLFKKGLGTIATASNDFRRKAAIGSLAGCFGIMIHSFFDFPLRTPSNGFVFLLLAAIATVSIKMTSDGDAPRRKRRSNAP